ncbi:MAG: hypothetical protein ACRDJI_11290 [Actinomycetota bacterium]
MTQFNPRLILETLSQHGVEYVVVGGIGGTLHGAPLLTDDVDIVPALKKTNLDSLANALQDMKAKLLTAENPEGVEVEVTGKRLQKWIVDFAFLSLLTEYGQLDLIYRPSGTAGYQELSANSEVLELGDVEVRVAALEDIIRSKQAAGRETDLQQLPTLRMLLERKQRGSP